MRLSKASVHRPKAISCTVVAVLSFAAIAAAQPEALAPSAEQRGGPPGIRAFGVVPLGAPTVYTATGVRDSATAATVVHCTNRSAEAEAVFVDIFDFDASFDCTMGFTIGSQQTRTFATRPTVVYAEDAVCSPFPGTAQGLLLIASQLPANRLMCAVEVVDPANATPVYQTSLDLFRP